MNDFLRRRDRYIRDSLAVRLGGIAANLARVKSFGKNPDNGQLISSLLRESGWFIEWSAPETDLPVAIELVAIQRQIVQWLADWPALWPNADRRQVVLERSSLWSQWILERSGLLD
ncbi:MAG: hypothetical protein ACAF42_17315 [Limnothrix sp. BL-A-16]|jgi:hypothetical protein